MRPELVTAVLKKLARLALDGNAMAGKVFLDRVLGRVPEGIPLEDESPEILALRLRVRLAELDGQIPKTVEELTDDGMRYL